MLKGISVGHDRTTILTIDGELEKVNYLGADYQIHTLEVSYFRCRFHANCLIVSGPT